MVVDRKAFLVMELRDDSKNSFFEAIGLSTYSNSKAGVLSYVAIFENLWKQTELYQKVKQSNEELVSANEQLKVHDKMQKEFINIAAHELRTPVQPILGLSDVLLSKKGNIEQYKELLDAIKRSAKRLQRLTEDILDITKIESQSLQLNKEKFNLCEMILNTIADSRNKINKKDNNNLKLELVRFKEENEDNNNEFIIVEADKARINQVIMNLLSNAIKFTKEGSITIKTEIKKDNQVHVSIKDTGQGIDPEIMPRLFTKFATKSEEGGTGLGLFISKSIVEAHGGKIWAKNNYNTDGKVKGATFTISLPQIKNNIGNKT